jgi:hypothetical protein
LNQTQLISLKEHYQKIYGEPPKSDADCIGELCRIFQEVMRHQFLTYQLREGIAEQYRLLKSDGIEAYYWMIEAFHVTSKKNLDKRHFKYVVGMLRNWKRYGFGYMPTQEESELVEYLEEELGIDLSTESRRLLKNYIIAYGSIKTTRMIGELQNNDTSYPMTVFLGELLKNKFGSRVLKDEEHHNIINSSFKKTLSNFINQNDQLEELVVTDLEVVNQDNTDQQNDIDKPKENNLKETRNKERKKTNVTIKIKKNNEPNLQVIKKHTPNEKSKTEASFAGLILSENKSAMRVSHLFKELKKYGVEVKDKSITSKINTYMKLNPNIIKVGVGLYNVIQDQQTLDEFVKKNEGIVLKA